MRKQRYENVFLIVSGIAVLFLLTEVVMEAFGTSLCSYEGCRTTAQHVRFGEASILFMGLAVFLSMTVMSFLCRSGGRPAIGRLLDFTLVVSLASEGFFMGYLAFRLHVVCLICVTIFGFIVALGVLRLLSGERAVLTGFAALATVFSLQYFVLPVGVPVHLPEGERLILFYSKDCVHCAEVVRELEAHNVKAAHLPATEYAMFLKNLGIEHVPTLMVNDERQKAFFTGKDAIERYLDACAARKRPATKPTNSGTARRVTGKTADQPSVGGAATDLFSASGLLTAGVGTSGADGMCRDDEICK